MASASPQSQPAWQYKTTAETVTIGLAGAAGAAAFVVGLSQIFNPVAVAAAVGYGVVKVTVGAVLPTLSKTYTSWMAAGWVKKGQATKLSQDDEANILIRQVSDKMGRPQAPEIYLLSEKMVGKIALPLGLRWVMKIPKISEAIMARTFASLAGTNVMFATREGLDTKLSKEALRFITAHELSHDKNDGLSPALLTKVFIKHTTRALLLGGIGALAVGIAGVSLPFSAVMGGSVLAAIGALTVVRVGSDIINNIGYRKMEARADRNGVYVTRNLEAATETMKFLHAAENPKPANILKKIYLPYPAHYERQELIRQAFNKASAYPKLEAAVNDNAVIPAAQKKPAA